MGYWGNQNVPAYPNLNPYTNYYNDNTSSSPNYSWGSNNYPTQPPYFYQQQPAYQSPSFQNIWQSQACQEAIANSRRNNERFLQEAIANSRRNNEIAELEAKLKELMTKAEQMKIQENAKTPQVQSSEPPRRTLAEMWALHNLQNKEPEKPRYTLAEMSTMHNQRYAREFMAQYERDAASAGSSQLDQQKAENPEISNSTDRSTISTDRLESVEQIQEVSTDRSLLQPVGQNSRTPDFEIFDSTSGCSDTAGEESDSDMSSEYSELSEDSCLGASEWKKYFSPTDAAGEESEVDCETVVVEEENTPKEDASPTLVRYTDVDFIFPSFQVPCQLSEFAIKFYAEMSYGKARSRDFPYRPYNFSKTNWHKILIRESHGLIKSGVYQRRGSISGALFDWLVWVATKVKLPKKMFRET